MHFHYLPIMIRTNVIGFILLFAAQVAAQSASGQDTYRSKDGSLSVTSVYQGQILTAHSKQVQVSLDYETSAFVFRLALADLHTGVDSLDRKLRSQTTAFVLKGNFSLSEIRTTQHPPQDFVLTGKLETSQGRITEITGTGRLEHIDGGEEMACELAAYFDTTPYAIGIDSAKTEQTVKVQFYKTILKKYATN